jgi:predicted nuclease of predicted toxin-antitoxin system
MKLLLDECTPSVLKADLVGHQVLTVEDAGFKGLKNGRLLRAAAARNFEVLVTVDKSLSSQQNLAAFGIAVLLLRARSNRYDDLKPLIPKALAALNQIQPGTVVIVKA